MVVYNAEEEKLAALRLRREGEQRPMAFERVTWRRGEKTQTSKSQEGSLPLGSSGESDIRGKKGRNCRWPEHKKARLGGKRKSKGRYR